MTPRLPSLALACLSLAACLEPPELEPWSPPDSATSGVDTWAAPEDAGLEDGGGHASSAEGAADTTSTSETSGGSAGDLGNPPSPADPALAHLRITEVLADPEGKDGGVNSAEFVELINPTNAPIPLGGILVDAASWPELDGVDLSLAELSLEPGALLVIQRWAKELEPDPTGVQVSPGVVTVNFRSSSGLRNADGSVSVGSSAQVADLLAYGESVDINSVDWLGSAVAIPGSGRSLCRPIDHIESLDGSGDTNTAEDWAECDPSPGALPEADPEPGDRGEGSVAPILPGDLVIVEVLADAPGPSDQEKLIEFVEIVNNSDVELDLQFVRIGDAPSFDSPGLDPLLHVAGSGGCEPATCLAPDHRAILTGDTYTGPVGSALHLSTDDSTLADGGLTISEAVTLWTEDGVLVSSYRLWPDPSIDPKPMLEQPMHRASVDAEDLPESWIEAPPSPGS
ncbi:hypothetical protein PPSIR1_12578 [Plesiocystis pacifica SIR-1]|uniref:LTD domain-containing protein n=1 Tax=Plesiocystis pacifica SIR-1 TaxID=391625 RepID=A6G020_9BACT|nr:lamin tail domain-containing protein [Plesiocystis pacifica]EDM80717.1 hypothetical protein PPSIR1_12578 [Plesiocystis pacifica SIR-1]